MVILNLRVRDQFENQHKIHPSRENIHRSLCYYQYQYKGNSNKANTLNSSLYTVVKDGLE